MNLSGVLIDVEDEGRLRPGARRAVVFRITFCLARLRTDLHDKGWSGIEFPVFFEL